MSGSPTLILGPILGIVSSHENKLYYTCCVVGDAQLAPIWHLGDAQIAFERIDRVTDGVLWKAEWQAPDRREKAEQMVYSITTGGSPCSSFDGSKEWAFYLPASDERMRFAYASCNGFSAMKLMASCESPHEMWRRMREDHALQPLSLLVMGGDQIYADGLWEQDWMRWFAQLTDTEMASAEVTPEIDAKIDAFYDHLYYRQWSEQAEIAYMLASVPSVMMWDDHDIFDGWGSHPDSLQKSPVFRRAYKAALRAFKLFQLRGDEKRMRLDPNGSHYSYALTLGTETVLMLDHRTERTPTQVMSAEQWQSLKTWVGGFSGARLFIQSAVPVVYRTFGLVERVLGGTAQREELEDDLMDHWSAREHQQERLRLFYTLIDRQKEIKRAVGHEADDIKWVFLSGDVHVGCVGVAWDDSASLGLYQIVSSGIVHPPPTPFQWLGITAVSGDGDERLGNGDLECEILQAAGASGKFFRTRNYARLEIGSDDKIWINWRCENNQQPVFAI